MKVRHLFIYVLVILFCFVGAGVYLAMQKPVRPYTSSSDPSILAQVARQSGESDDAMTDSHGYSGYGAYIVPLATTTSVKSPQLSVAISSSTQPIRMFFAGDLMLDRNVRGKINTEGFDSVFSDVKNMIAGMDIAEANLEGPFTNNPSVTLGVKNAPLQFTFDPALAPKLKALGFTTFGLANNHTDNYGAAGLASTRSTLLNAGLKYFGDPDNQDQISTVMTVRGVKIAFVGFDEYTEKNLDKVLAEITRLRPLVDFIVVQPHWGVEYQPTQTKFQEDVGHAMIDRGADLIVAASPHVVQPIEMYKGKPIFFSLGNFEFDQNFSDATTHGLAVQVDLTPIFSPVATTTTVKTTVTSKAGKKTVVTKTVATTTAPIWHLSPHYTLLPIYINDSHPELEQTDVRLSTLQKLSQTASALTSFKKDILAGWLP